MSLRIRLKIGENEIEVEGEESAVEKHLKNFVEKYSKELIEVKGGSANLPARVVVQKETSGKSLSPAEYVRQKNPKGGTEQLIVLAKYLEDYKSLSEFSIKDINKVAKDAKLGKIDNSYYPQAVKQGLLNKIKYGRYQLTLTGEDAVVNMSAPKQ